MLPCRPWKDRSVARDARRVSIGHPGFARPSGSKCLGITDNRSPCELAPDHGAQIAKLSIITAKKARRCGKKCAGQSPPALD